MPGRWTLTTTASPVRSRARWVWPIDAAASGSQSNSAKTSSTVAPSSASSTAAMRSRGSGGTRFCSVASSSHTSAGQQVDAGGGDLAELDVDAAGLLEHPAQAHRLAVDVDRRAGRRERPEALPPGQADELAVAAEHGDPPADGADRAGR